MVYSLFYENYHPVIIEVPKKGDHTLKEVLGPVSGGLKYKKLKVDNCVHTGIASEDKPKIRKIGTDEMKMLIDFIHNPKNEDIMKRNKALAFQTYRVWPRCVMKLNVPTVPYPSISMPSLPSSSDLVGSLSMLPSLM